MLAGCDGVVKDVDLRRALTTSLTPRLSVRAPAAVGWVENG